MELSSPVYLAFTGLIWLILRGLPAPRGRKCVLLAASIAFYALLDLRYLFLLIVIGLLTYGLGIAIGRGCPAGLCTAAGIAVVLAALAFYKYSAVWVPILRLFHPASVSGWLLPVGISFYTFQAISYLIDVSRRRIEPVRDGVDFGLYLAFFPKVVAGPIVRPRDFFGNLAQGPKPAQREDLADIFGLFVRGLFKKVVIADALAGLAGVGFQAASASGAGLFPAPVYWRSFYLFAFQIYADFSGYTDIARASGRLLGIRLPENFQRPYFAASITEFWNRWHMSLTQWFREYVFFPLNRRLLRSARRIHPGVIQTGTTITTMLLIGLWHGAGLPYLAWGLWHGLLLSVEKRSAPRLQPPSLLRSVLSGAVVFHLTAAGWILFRSDSLAAAGRFVSGMIAGGQWFLIPEILLPVAASAAAVLAVDAAGAARFPGALRSSGFLRGAVSAAAATMIGAIWLIGWSSGGGGLPFIYGNF
jgi:alginate O-acetyltransferase complex protein AlgI